jgi:hypothetical protein
MNDCFWCICGFVHKFGAFEARAAKRPARAEMAPSNGQRPVGCMPLLPGAWRQRLKSMCRGDARHREWRWCAPEGEWRAARVQAGRADWQKAAAAAVRRQWRCRCRRGAVPEGCESGQAVLRRPRPGGCSRCSADCAILWPALRRAWRRAGRFMSGAPVSVTGCAPMPPSIGRHCGQSACRAPPGPGGSVAALQRWPAAQISSNGWLLHCTAWAVRL